MTDLDLARIKRNVAKMAAQNAPEADIDGYIASEGATIDAVRAFRPPSITADATGQRFDESGVPVGGVPMAEPQRPTAPDRPRFGGAAMNLTAGANEAMYGIAGLPVDAMRGAMNMGVRGFNAATGAEVPTIPENSFGGSRSIAEAAGTVAPELDPRNTAAQTSNDRLARGVGQGVGGSVAPAGIVGGLQRAGVSVSPLIQALAGRNNSSAAVAADATAGAAAGAGSSLAQEFASDRLDPVAALAGGVVGGGLGAVATGIPGLVRAGAGAVNDFTAPLRQSGRERLAGERLVEAAQDPAQAMRAIEEAPPPAIPGSRPTTFQQTGDMGLGALEREMQTKFSAQFQQRRADQNTARREAIDAIQPTGAPEQVTRLLRERVKAIDEEFDANLTAARDWERGATRAMGPGQTAEDAGDAMRASLQKRRDAAMERENQLYGAVDPNGTLALPATGTREMARRIVTDMPKLAKPPSPEETALYSGIVETADVLPFRELSAYRSRVSQAIADERGRHGKSPAWARMVQLRGAIEADLESAVARQAANDDAAVAAGRMKAEETVTARLERVPTLGNTVYTPSGRSVQVDYEVVDASTLRTSNGADGRPDPAYPAELQPRDRGRAASDAQITTMARNLQPDRLGPSSEASTGAPIVGPDGIVESGNGRVLALRRAYGENGTSAKAYRDYLASQGYDTTGMREPVLIRRRSGEMSIEDRARFAQEGNASSSMSMSASEQAATDATRLTPDVLRLYRTGDVNSAENRDFARAFLGSVADRGQEGAFVTGGGGLSVDGAGRMRNALLASAYDDTRLVAALADEGDENIKAFGRALSDISGDVARLRAGIRDGQIEASADISPALTEAARIVQRARAGNVRISDLVAQADAFSPVSDAAVTVLRMAYGDRMDGRLSRDRLNGLMRWAIGEAEQQVVGARLFGEALDATAILAGARARYGSAAQAVETSGFSGGSPAGSGNGPLRSGEGRSGGVPDGAPQSRQGGGGPEGQGAGGNASGGRGGRVDPRILEQPALEPNFPADAKARLDVATEATRQRAATFDNRQLGPLLSRRADHDAYSIESARVATRVFQPGPAGFEKVQQYRRAAGPDGMAAIEAYAVDSLRRAAIDRDTGAVNPQRLETWRRSHSDALRAFPELDTKIRDATDAGRAIETQAVARKAALDEEQRGAFGRLIGAEAPEDVTRIVGGIFSRQDAVTQLAAVRRRVAGDEAALGGLRRAVAEHFTQRLVSNTEAATSGRELLKADQFQTFVKQNRAALRAVFTEKEVNVLEAVAADMQRANRSLSSVKIPNQSNTAQDQRSMLQQIMASGMENWVTVAGGTAGAAVGGAPGAAVGGGAAALFNAMRLNGIESVDELVRDAMLHPERARFLMSKVPKDPEQADVMMRALARRYVKAATVGAAVDPMDERPKTGPVRLPAWVTDVGQGPSALQRALAER